MSVSTGEWNKKGAALSDKSALKKFYTRKVKQNHE